ncbi:ATP-dependent endonuclease [Amycolatopsis sp. A1MSW2902]|uniref:ATP-dependent nuclease n=1 Tax=Amycolatopsis sp. A1MSW2902 TaxID=687413 RepID=UPI00307FBD5F
MHLERLVLQNFQCFGPEPVEIELLPELTAFLGANGSGKTAACRALSRMFGISADDRTVRPGDFHIPMEEQTPPETRALRIEALLGFPELEVDDPASKAAVPEFFHRMAASSDGVLKCRLVLEATWEADGTLEGSVTETRLVVQTLETPYREEDCVPLPAAERARIQMIYVPASRDGARQVAAFLRSRLWRAARWSEELRDLAEETAAELAVEFRKEPATSAVERVLAGRWRELHDAGTHTEPRFRPLESDFAQLLGNAELVFEPDPTGRAKPARELSDGQRSLLHLALLSTTLDIEADVAAGKRTAEFDLGSAHLPSLTLVAVEEPENSLSPFFLSRIVTQLQALCISSRAQVVLASHSAGVLHRIDPKQLRYFRMDHSDGTASVRKILLPAEESEEAKYVREAIRAHPELYFAKFVVLGEGDSEELVIPRIAQAVGVSLDPSFVAMAPLGGRHTNHFWRLLTDLGIPHTTLLDLDYGRAGGGAGRIREAFTRLIDYNVKPFAGLPGFSQVEDITDDLTLDQLAPLIAHLRGHGVYFSEPLDLDYAMLTAFPDAYKKLDDGERGPQNKDAHDAVLGTDGKDHGYWTPEDDDEASKLETALQWYRYLFLSRSKPSSHLRVLASLSDLELGAGPEVLTALIEAIRKELEL